MPIENDFTRVFGAIKELEERVERMEGKSPGVYVWNPSARQLEFGSIPTPYIPTSAAEPDYKALYEAEQREARATREVNEVLLNNLSQLAEKVDGLRGELAELETERGIDAECRLLTLKSLEHTTSENNQLRFILSILAAVKDDGWIEWHGGNNPPVGNDVRVDVCFRDGDELHHRSPEQFRWGHIPTPRDIIAYRIAR
jgi:hypothetical protein